jgi:hypothetical protein
MLPVVLGGINSGNRVIAVSYKSNPNGTYIPYFLNYITSANFTGYAWQNTLVFGDRIPIFHPTSSNGSASNIILTDIVNLGGLGYDNSNILTNVPVSQLRPLNFDQVEFAPWNPPTLLLAGIPYVVKSTSDPSLNLSWYYSFTGLLGSGSIIFLPLGLYGNCTPRTYEFLDDPVQIISNWFCTVNGTSSFICNNLRTFPLLWNTLEACNIGYDYDYCLAGQSCSDCNGPCPLVGNICTYEGSGEFICVPPLGPPVPVPWYQSPYFYATLGILGGLIVLGIIITLLIIMNLNANRHRATALERRNLLYSSFYSVPTPLYPT